MIEAATVNAISMIMLLRAMAMYPRKRLIHLFVANARYTTPDWCGLGWPGRAAGLSSTILTFLRVRRRCQNGTPIAIK